MRQSEKNREGDSFFIDGLPPGRVAVEWDESDPPGVERAYLFLSETPAWPADSTS